MVNCQGSYYSVSCGPTALKIYHDTVHQQEGQTCPDRCVAQAATRLETAVIKFKNKERNGSYGDLSPCQV